MPPGTPDAVPPAILSRADILEKGRNGWMSTSRGESIQYFRRLKLEEVLLSLPLPLPPPTPLPLPMPLPMPLPLPMSLPLPLGAWSP